MAEAIGATIFVGLSLDYCLHLAHAYNEAPMSESLEKMRHALVVIGPKPGIAEDAHAVQFWR